MTGTANAALASVNVFVYTTTGAFVKNGFTASDGTYSVSGLPAGNYVARTFVSSTLNYVDEVWDNITCLNCSVTTGTPISVTAGATTPGINFALVPGGTISGTVTDTGTSAVLNSINVQIFTSTGALAKNAFTNTSGVFSVTGLPAGTYYVKTQTAYFSGYIDELYNDIPCPVTINCTVTTGTGIPVTVGTTQTANFALSHGGSISGTVTDAGTLAGLSGLNIVVYTSTGLFVNSAVTAAGGTYTVVGLPTSGNYFARTVVPSTMNYLDQLYNNLSCLNCSVTTGTPIGVTAGTTTSSINFALQAGGAISGVVTDAGTGFGILGAVTVQIYASSGSVVKSAATLACQASYTVNGLPTGTYYARTFVPSALNYVDEAYDNVPCLNCSPNFVGAPIAVTVGATHTGIDFGLSPGGIITRFVTDAGTLAGLASVNVNVYTSTGAFAKGTSTPSTGSYTVRGLPTGTYYARTFVASTVNYVDQLWNGMTCLSCTVTTGTAIAVTAGGTQSGINFPLSPGGTITGAVTDTSSTPLPLASVTVQVFTSTGAFAKSTGTSGTGSYSITGLPAGNYFARTAVPNTLNYVDELWDNIPCLGCTVTAGTAINVTVGATHSGVNFALAGGGTIGGAVTDAVVTSTGLANVNVTIYTSTGVGIKSVATTSTGAYAVVGLPTGAYFARTFVPSTLNYVDELFDNIPCVPGCTITSGTAISVTAGVTTTASFALSPAGSITGTVTDAGTVTGLSGVTVQIYTSTGSSLKSTVTTSTGSHTVVGLTTGTYFARTFVPSTLNYIDELYDDFPCVPGCTITAGTAIGVTLGSAHGGVNFALSPGGIIAGTVTNQNTSAALSGLSVQIYTSTGAFAKGTSTTGTGSYSVGGLPTGSYFARTAVNATQFYVDEVYNNIACFNCNGTAGTPIAVTAGLTHGAIDFALAPGGTITGLVTDAGTTAPIGSVSVLVLTSAGAFLKSSASNSSGSYTVGGLPPGTYYARTGTPASLNYIDEVFDNIPCVPCVVQTTGAPIVVAAGAAHGGIDFALSPGGIISGTATDEVTTAGLNGVTIQLFTSSGAFLGVKNIVTGLVAGSPGFYSVGGLPAGTYYARTAVPPSLNYVDELYDNFPCLSCSVTTGTAITVTVGATRGGVNFALSAGGAISGIVTDAATSAGLVSLPVSVVTSTGAQVKIVATGAGGSYTIAGLPAGTYYALTFGTATQYYADQLYNGIPCTPCNATTGTPIPVTAGATTGGINFALQPGGVITGIVTDATSGAGLAPVTVQVFTSTGAGVKSVGTAAAGTYVVTGLPPGTYFARTFVSALLPYVDELWDNITCLNCSVTTGTPIVVTAGVTHSGVNFGLATGGAIAGTVSDAGTIAGLSSVTVRIFTSTGVAAKQVSTSVGGGFTVGGLPAGSYFARTLVPPALNYVDELYDNIACGTCVVTTGTAINVTAGATHSGVNFGLAGSTHAPPPSLMVGTGLRFSLVGELEQWASTQAVAGRSYCAAAVADRTAVSSQPYGAGISLQFVAFRGDGTTVLSSDTGVGFGGACFVAPATETLFFKVKQTDAVTRQYQLRTVETTLWANWFFVAGDYSSFTLLRNTGAAADFGQINATITWRDASGAVATAGTLPNPFNVIIKPGGTVFANARDHVDASTVTAGSVEVAYDNVPQGLVGSQTTLSGTTGLSFDTLMMSRQAPRR